MTLEVHFYFMLICGNYREACFYIINENTIRFTYIINWWGGGGNIGFIYGFYFQKMFKLNMTMAENFQVRQKNWHEAQLKIVRNLGVKCLSKPKLAS